MEESETLRSKLKFSVVIPVFNEEGNLEVLHTRLSKVMESLGEPYEVIFIDDGSTDSSFQVLKGIHQKDNSVKAIRFTRNFGQHTAIAAGLHYCRGELVVSMDADLQDQPEDIPKLLDKLNEGYEIVYALLKERQDSFMKKLSSKVYLWFLAKLTNQTINPEIPTFRMMTRRVVDYINELRERSRFYGGLVAWLGFPYAIVPVEHGERFAGKTKYSLWKMIRLATEGIVSFSDIPLRLIGYFGLMISAASFILGIYVLIRWFVWGIPLAGYTSIIVSIFFLGGVTLVVLGVIGRYLGGVLIEVKGRPLYVVRDVIE
jgi:dolichol-phosphate mannosyltransferase